MPLTLSNHDISRLQSALAVLLSPLDYPSSESWLAESSRCASKLLGADQALCMVPRPTPGAPLMTGMGYDVPRAVEEYGRNCMEFDVGLHDHRQTLGLEVYHQWHLYDPGPLHHSYLYNDWCTPHRLMDVVGIGYNPVPGEPIACLHFYHDQDHGPEDSGRDGAFGKRGLQLLELLLPAWKAGVRQHLTLGACREQLNLLLDRLEEGVAIFDVAGRERYRNAALVQLLKADGQGTRIDSIIHLAGRRLAAAQVAKERLTSLANTLPLAQTVQTGSSRYSIETSHTNLPVLGSTPMIVVVVRPLRPAPLTDSELIARFRLTPRECETARLLAAARSNTEVATTLGVTKHTARRHTEAVLRKLGVASRAAVGTVLRGGE